MRSRRRRLLPMAGPYVDPHTRPMTPGERILTVIVVIAAGACLVGAMLLGPVT